MHAPRRGRGGHRNTPFASMPCARRARRRRRRCKRGQGKTGPNSAGRKPPFFLRGLRCACLYDRLGRAGEERGNAHSLSVSAQGVPPPAEQGEETGARTVRCKSSPAGRGTYFRVVFPFAGALGLRGQRAVPSARYETPALCARLPRRRSARLVVRLTWPRTSAPNAAASAPRSSAARALGGEPRHQRICAAVVRPAIMGFQRGCARVCSRSEGGGLTGRARDSPPVRLVRAPEP